jgi:arabinose-5-phosphate isomerase
VSGFDAVAVARRVLGVEAEALAKLAGSLGSAFVEAVDVLAAAKGRVTLTGIGKSGHVGRKIASTLASTGQPAQFVHATEAAHGDLGMIGPGDVVIALSKSGEQREFAPIIAYAKRFAIPLIAVTAAADSTLGHAADIVLCLPAVPEAAEALDPPTTSTTLMMALGDALAVVLLERRGFTASHFSVLHPGGKLGAGLRLVAELMHGPDELPLVAPETPMADAIRVMSDKRFGCVGVANADGRLVGIITDGDLRRHIDGLLDHTAAEIMTTTPRTATREMLAAEALQLIAGVTVLFVVDDERPVGILSMHDLLRAGVM